ncbi:MAG: hypothetical protein IJU04_00320 [Ruminococcus sp.]|nr:hypothetical protein [Ruminococcus sp.]
MQRMLYVNNEQTNVKVSNYSYNKSMKDVNDLLADGWHVAMIVCANENAEGIVGAYVVVERD